MKNNFGICEEFLSSLTEEEREDFLDDFRAIQKACEEGRDSIFFEKLGIIRDKPEDKNIYDHMRRIGFDCIDNLDEVIDEFLKDKV